METAFETKKRGKAPHSITLKAAVIAFLTLLLLIPSLMIQNLIDERQNRSREAIERINDKWSRPQTLCGPVLSVPYCTSVVDEHAKKISREHVLQFTPEELQIDTRLFPEERHYGIYKTILYKSEISISGHFADIQFKKIDCDTIYWERASLSIGFSDLRGITNNLVIQVDGQPYTAEIGKDMNIGNSLAVSLNETGPVEGGRSLTFSCTMNLNGSGSISYIPVGKTTKVHTTGMWESPGYFGGFSPEASLTADGFDARWSVLRFNRNIPDTWVDNPPDSFDDTRFGVSLVDMVDQYQQNMRSAKYAVLFIILTFLVFFFIELLTDKRIHPIQYLLVGAALILFYTLLLSLSEQLSFAWAYLIAGIATISLISVYSHSIFKNKMQTGIMAFTLSALYIFLYTVLQLEDIALLIGSIGLFVILAIVMFVSRKITWYKQEESI
jgi:inner membrane protein